MLNVVIKLKNTPVDAVAENAVKRPVVEYLRSAAAGTLEPAVAVQ